MCVTYNVTLCKTREEKDVQDLKLHQPSKFLEQGEQQLAEDGPRRPPLS